MSYTTFVTMRCLLGCAEACVSYSVLLMIPSELMPFSNLSREIWEVAQMQMIATHLLFRILVVCAQYPHRIQLGVKNKEINDICPNTLKTELH